jgi:hypothetical protein
MLSLPMPAFRIESLEDSIELTIDEVWGYPHEISYGGGYAAKGTLSIHIGEYAVNNAAHYFTTGELYKFLLQLQYCYNILDGTAVLKNTERELALTCLFNRRGHVLVEGSFQSNPALKNILSFEFSTDQTQIPQILSSLSEVASIFGGNHGVENQPS